MRIQSAVGGNDAVAVEVVVRGRIASVVAAISKDLLTCNRTLVAHSLVDEVPDVAALILRVFAHQVPILLETSHRVAHSVSILTLDKRSRIVFLRIGLTTFVAVVHRTEDVGLAPVASLLVLHGTRLVVVLNPRIAFLEVGAVAGFVA